ncbi:MAG: NADH-quinone oxidoreductase subunit J [Alphaproteobacteria bacterium]
MNAYDMGFYALATGIAGTSFLFLYLKNPIRVLLAFAFLVVAIVGLLILSGAIFPALLVLVFYAALISAFLIFHMMTQNHTSPKVPPLTWGYKVFSLFILSALAAEMGFVLIHNSTLSFDAPVKSETSLSPTLIGEILYTDYPFFVVYLGILFFVTFLVVILLTGSKKSKSSKQRSVEKVQRNMVSIELKDLKFTKDADETDQSEVSRPDQAL